MTTKITLDPALVREVLGMTNMTGIESIIIDTNKTNDFLLLRYIGGNKLFEENLINQGWNMNLLKNSYFLDIHRFKDMAIEWCAGKGWGISRWDDGTAYVKGPSILDKPSIFSPKPTRLSAELAAISFVYEQIQKEGKI